MPFWPFARSESDPQTPEQLRAQLVAAVGTRRLKRLCRQHAQLARESVGTLIQVPEEIRARLDSDPASMEQYTARMVAVAQCLAECGVPDVWEAMVGTPETNPILRWDDWLGRIPERMAALEYAELIAEARELISEARSLDGSAPRQYEGYLRGRLGEALFHSGDVDGAAAAYADALQYCRQQRDHQGVAAYLGNLKEIARYRQDADAAIAWARQLAAHHQAQGEGAAADGLRTEIQRLGEGEPPVRAVCRLPWGTFELDDVKLSELQVGVSYKFEFVRNRPSLRKCVELTRRGAQLATDGQLADALEQFEAAAQVDPYDPDPLYQSGAALMELGAYDQAREHFDEVHRIAPGWYHCQSDRWLAEQLQAGNYPPEVWTALRGLQDFGLEPPQVLSLARQLVERFDDFALFWLLLGEAQRDTGDTPAAIESFRRGLGCELEPDIQSRLQLALGSSLEADSTERQSLLEHVANSEGNLFARSVARIMLPSGDRP